MGQLHSSLRRRHPLVRDPWEIAQWACLRCVTKVWLSTLSLDHQMVVVVGGHLWLQSKTAKHSQCFRQNKAMQFPTYRRRDKKSKCVFFSFALWDFAKMSVWLLVNGALPSSSRATMPLYNGQSPLQLGLSGLKLDQDSKTVCLR